MPTILGKQVGSTGYGTMRKSQRSRQFRHEPIANGTLQQA